MSLIDTKSAKKKQKAAAVSFMTAFFLGFLKISIFFISGSLAILASALDSFMDTFISLGNFFAIKEANKPPDKEHSFGHGKIEALSSFIQAIIISISGLFLIYKSIDTFINPSEIKKASLAILVMIFSVLINFFLVRFLNKTSNETDSIALKGDSLHYATDLWTNLAVILTLILINFLNYYWLDPLIGFLLALYIIYSTYDLFKESVKTLTDHELDDAFREKIIEKIEKAKPQIKGYHKLKTRRAGSEKFVEFHMVFNKDIALYQAHELAQRVIDDIEESFHQTRVMVHFDTPNSR